MRDFFQKTCNVDERQILENAKFEKIAKLEKRRTSGKWEILKKGEICKNQNF